MEVDKNIMVDLTTLIEFLSPFLADLVRLERGGAQSLNTADGQKAQAIWKRLQPVVQRQEGLEMAIVQVTAKPESKARQTVLQEELETCFAADPGLAKAIAQVMQPDGGEGNPVSIRQQVIGSQNQVMEQVSGGIVIGPGQSSITIGSSDIQVGATAPPVSPSPDETGDPKTILVVAANPKGTSPLSLDQEVQGIQAGLERAKQRDRFVLHQQWATTVTQLRRSLLDYQPQIVHFSGHGVGGPVETEARSPLSRDMGAAPAIELEPEGLIFEDEQGRPQRVSGEALAGLFGLFADGVECVVLNACYSEAQAQDIVRHIPYVVGMSREIGDRAAIEFAVGFYDAVLAGQSIEFAFSLGCNALQLAGIPEHLTPILKQRI